MRTLLYLALFFNILTLSNCKKSNDAITHINCDGLITDTLGTNDNAKIYIPNGFTPNNDGLNDMYRPVTYNVASIIFIVYDEQNNVVFTTNQLNQGWQTTVANNSFTKYYYKMQAITQSNHKIGMCGEVFKLACIPNDFPTALQMEDQITANGFVGTTNDYLPVCP